MLAPLLQRKALDAVGVALVTLLTACSPDSRVRWNVGPRPGGDGAIAGGAAIVEGGATAAGATSGAGPGVTSGPGVGSGSGATSGTGSGVGSGSGATSGTGSGVGIGVGTGTPTSTPVPTNTNTALPTNTPFPTNTHTALPTSTPFPTNTSTALPTNTPLPTNTHTALPTNTPLPTNTNTTLPTSTHTALPTNTPIPTSTDTPAPTQTSTPVGPPPTPAPPLTVQVTGSQTTVSHGSSTILTVVGGAGPFNWVLTPPGVASVATTALDGGPLPSNQGRFIAPDSSTAEQTITAQVSNGTSSGTVTFTVKKSAELDTTFGGGDGIATFPVVNGACGSCNDRGYSLTLDENGDLLVLARATGPSTTMSSTSTHTTTKTDGGSQSQEATSSSSITVDPAVAFAVLKVNPADGTLRTRVDSEGNTVPWLLTFDPELETGGTAPQFTGMPGRIVVQGSGGSAKYLISGTNKSSENRTVIFRMNPDGSLDGNFSVANENHLIYAKGENYHTRGLATHPANDHFGIGKSYGTGQLSTFRVARSLGAETLSSIDIPSQGTLVPSNPFLLPMNGSKMLNVGSVSDTGSAYYGLQFSRLVFTPSSALSADTGFGVGGILNVPMPGFSASGIRPGAAGVADIDGGLQRAVVAGYQSGKGVWVAGVDTNGSSRTGYTAFGNAGQAARAVIVQRNGGVIVLGYHATTGGQYKSIRLRFNASAGSFAADTAFSAISGFAGGSEDGIESAVQLPDGRIVALGYMRIGGRDRVMLVKFWP